MISDNPKKEYSTNMETLTTFKPVCANEQEPVLKYKLLTTKAYPPTRKTPGSIGYDLKAPDLQEYPLEEAHIIYPWE